MNGAEMIAAERRRQVEEEGYSAFGDSLWRDAELAVAAWCYLGDYTDEQRYNEDEAPAEWPWELGSDQVCTWKPTPDDPVRQLVKAGALIAAEIDRLQAAS